MSFSAPLFSRDEAAPEVPTGLPLVIALTGFSDAGGAVARLLEYFREEIDTEPVIAFSNDALLDYRARRPMITFDEDHLTDYEPPRLGFSLAYDGAGAPFVLLSGYEPDFAWESFAETVIELSAALQVSSVTWVHAIPMPVPHTRPIGVTVSGTREDLVAAHSVWRPRTHVPSTVGHLLEYRFAEVGAKVVGFVLLVPHYLGDTEFPAAALAGLDGIAAATGLTFSGDSLRDENKEYLGKVEEQVSGSDELTRMVETLEERYDSYMAGSTNATPIIHTGDLPSADELAAELERFLAGRTGDDDRRSGPFG